MLDRDPVLGPSCRHLLLVVRHDDRDHPRPLGDAVQIDVCVVVSVDRQDYGHLPAFGRDHHLAPGDLVPRPVLPDPTRAGRAADDVEPVAPLHPLVEVLLLGRPRHLVEPGSLRNDVRHYERGVTHLCQRPDPSADTCGRGRIRTRCSPCGRRAGIPSAGPGRGRTATCGGRRPGRSSAPATRPSWACPSMSCTTGRRTASSPGRYPCSSDPRRLGSSCPGAGADAS
jgi:hypothetical protein